MGITGVNANYGCRGHVSPKTGTTGGEKFAESISSVTATDDDNSKVKEEMFTKEEILQMISERSQEIYEKLKNNDTETSFQIGSQSFTIKEWDRLIEQFDTVQEDIREQMQEEQAKRQKEITTRITKKVCTSVTSKDSTDIAKAAGITVPDSTAAAKGVEAKDSSVMDSLVTESTTCTYPASNEKDPEEMYITWYTQEGIFCRKAGQTEGYFWSVSFEEPSQYNKVIKFLGRLDADVNYRFAAHENFWQDFLMGKVDEDDFADFLNGMKNGMPTYTHTGDDSGYIDEEMFKYAVYLDSPEEKY